MSELNNITGLEIEATPEIKQYFKLLNERVREKFELAQKARQKNLDSCNEVECLPVLDLAERTESIVGPIGVAKRFRELFKEMNGNRLKTTFKIFEEIIEQKWYSEPDESKRVEQGIKTCMTLETEGVVVSPLDGVPKIEINKNPDGSRFVDVYYAGPIRAAGGKISALPLILGDFARKLLGLDVFKSTEEEVERYVEEIMIYQHEIISRQLTLTEDEIRLIVRNCPTCINGVPTEEREVAVHRDLPRIQSNRIRGGVALVVTEGVALKADWILEKTKNFGLDWKWLENIIKIEKKSDSKIELKKNFKYLNGLAAGRPLLSYPMAIGGFRARYGRGRNTGLMAKAINPATMVLLDEFIAVGTHIKIERPGKAAQLFPCTSIDGPIVLLKSGEVLKVNSRKQAEEIKAMVKKILFLGDLLIPFGDFRKSAHPLVPSPYVEEWFALELEKAMKISFNEALNFSKEMNDVKAVELAERFSIPLNPRFIHFYNLLKLDELKNLIEQLHSAEIVREENLIKKIRLIHNDVLKSFFETIGLPHKLVGEKIVIEEMFAFSLLKTFGVLDNKKIVVGESVLKILSNLSGIEIKDKTGTFIGARMGRPEQAKPREMKGNPHVLFPIALAGGNTRSINKAMEFSAKGKQGRISVEIALFKCPKCSSIVPTTNCIKCNVRTVKIWICPSCSSTIEKEFCERCKINASSSSERNIELDDLMRHAVGSLKMRLPDNVKGVKGLINDKKIPEALEKGILRAKHGLHVFRDGTSRYELLNATITHFKPREIGLSIEKVKELGYSKDFQGKEITSVEQTIEIFPQDIIVFEGCGDWLVKVGSFCNELLEKFYGLPSAYNIKSRNDLIGELVIGLAPHTSAGVVARIIGYSKTRLGWGHPYFVTAKRRNVDGDQDSVMLLMDALLNFSENYLSIARGNRMDAPLVFTTNLRPTEIDNEAYEIETITHYPLEFFEKSLELSSPFFDFVPIVENKLGKIEQYSGINFTHFTDTFDEGPKQSSYVRLKTMEEKIKKQVVLQKKILAVDSKDALERVMNSHFLPDIIGNTRAFSRQTFRCTTCNKRYRRVPLIGKCIKCSGNIILTIAEGSVKKYLKIAKELIHKHNLSDYMKQRIALTEKEIKSVFEDERVEQKSLFEYL